jgi:hypothetical protein
MSETTVAGVDGKAYLVGWLQMVTGMTVADIKAIPDDKWNECYGGCARCANELIGDTVANLKWTAGAVKGVESGAYDQMADYNEKCKDKQTAISLLTEASAELADALNAASDEHLNSTTMAPWQAPTPVFTLAMISVNHIWYHDGQLNYIQGMLGDEKVHWMGD